MSDDWRPAAERALARGHAVDRLIGGFLGGILLDSPISLIGYLYGSAIGWVWGGMWSTGRVERRAGLWVFRGMPSWTFARGGVCIGGCYLTGDVPPDEGVLRHEAVHKRQWRRYGLLMPVLYLFAGRNPLTNRFEIEAGLADGRYVAREDTPGISAATAAPDPPAGSDGPA